MPKFKINVYVDDIYVKTIYRENDNVDDAENDVLHNLDIALDVEELE